jgi:hypothetical protein
LADVAKILKVPAEPIKNFDKEKAVNFLSNTFNEGSIAFQNNSTALFI